MNSTGVWACASIFAGTNRRLLTDDVSGLMRTKVARIDNFADFARDDF
jgi:hypothetical protein